MNIDTSTIQRIPILSGLIYTNIDDHWKALEELFITVGISTAPLWVGGAAAFMLQSGTRTNAILDLVAGGELFLYAASLLAPIIYIAHEERPSARRVFPTRLGHVALTGGCLMICATYFAINRVGQLFDSTNILWMSGLLFVFSIGLLYLATAYRNSTVRPGAVMKRDEELLTEDVRRSR